MGPALETASAVMNRSTPLGPGSARAVPSYDEGGRGDPSPARYHNPRAVGSSPTAATCTRYHCVQEGLEARDPPRQGPRYARRRDAPPGKRGALEPRFRDHNLFGDWQGFRECHVEPDWLLIYRIEADEITFVRTATHADLFDE